MGFSNFYLKINEKYSLVPLLGVEKDNIKALFKNKRTVYICNYPDESWYKKHNFKQTTNYSIEKKYRFFKLLNKEAKILSLTEDSKIQKETKSYSTEEVVHFGSKFNGRIGQLFMMLKLIKWLYVNRKTYDSCLCYNFSPSEILSSFFSKLFLRKKIIVDFEDDYLLKNNSKLYKFYFSLVKRIPNYIICINKEMVNYFPNKKTFVFNGFINLDYAQNIDFRLQDDFTLLYAGALDDIRGVDLIPDLVRNLRLKYKNFKINITGSGPLEREINNWNLPEVNFFGFLNSKDYNNVLIDSTGYLILQKPDHPFSKGSFPSKIEYYSKFKKPIYQITLSYD
uniref:hypothetical protein n=1 Tax=uncultured Polaribacter sp. TaxID=174711 RepID=UPI002609D19B|nr:hypothetical protein [uncultured Polaribacter sp.]